MTQINVIAYRLFVDPSLMAEGKEDVQAPGAWLCARAGLDCCC
jgi:hypothetical protein